MRFDCIILDFDGTFTEVDKEAQPFVATYKRATAELLGRSIDDAWTAAEQRILAQPDSYGWEYEGSIVAPSHADPYIFTTATAQLVFDTLGVLADRDERAQAMQQLFQTSYPQALVVFRPEAREVVEAILDAGTCVYVVTNSSGAAVSGKIDSLAPRGREKLTIHGDAKKYVLCDPDPLDAVFNAVPAETTIEGLARPVFLRRGRYYEALRTILTENGTTPDRTLVCGDIFELDLALPAAIGMHVHLVTREGTRAYERDAASVSRGGHSADLKAMLKRALGK